MAGGRLFSDFIRVFGGFKDTRIVLMYHRVVESLPVAGYDSALFVTSSTLDMHINELSHFFEIVPLDNLLEHVPGSRRCAITFDDGWRDNYDFAFPVLKKYSVPATIFIPPNMMGNSRQYWFDNIFFLSRRTAENNRASDFINLFQSVAKDWAPGKLDSETTCELISKMKILPATDLETIVEDAFSRLSVKRPYERTTLSWDEIYEMGENGITFGPHGLNHYILPSVGSELKASEISDSLGILREKKVAISPIFSFPNGDWDDESIQLIKDTGYKGAVTTRLGVNNSSTDTFLINRIGLHEDISNTPSLLWYRILQAVNSKGY